MYIPEHYQEYQTAIRAAGRPLDLVEGTIIFTDATTMSIDSSVLLSNAISISKQCVDGDSLMFGGVFTSVLKLSLLTDVDRYKFFGAKIQLFYEIEIELQEGTDEPTYQMEQVPLGVFYVADADRPGDEVVLTAYDSMTLLDKELGDAQITGSAWDAFNLISTFCQYPLAFTQEDLSQFVNTDFAISGSALDGLKTYRDVVKQLCQLLGCFALDDRTGRLALKKFSTTPDITLGDNETGEYPWYTYVPADYESAFVGVSITSSQQTYQKHAEGAVVAGSMLVMEDAPAWDYGTEEANTEKTNNIYGLLYDDERQQPVFTYTPGSVDMPSDATFECGDMIRFYTQYSDEPYDFIITSIEWKFHNGMDLESVGINPILESSSTSANAGGRLLSQSVEKSRLQFVTFTNSSEIKLNSIHQTEKIGSCQFRPTTNTTALFIATILVEVSGVPDVEQSETSQETETVEVPVYAYNEQAEVVPLVDANGNPVDHLTATGTNTFTYTYTDKRDGKCEISIFYRFDGTIMPNAEDPYVVIEELANGQHVITVSYPINLECDFQRHNFDIYMTANCGETTEVVIPFNTLKATLVGQEIDEIARWDGNIRVDDESPFELVALGNVGVNEFYHGDFVISVNPEEYDPTIPNQIYIQDAIVIPTVIEHISLYALGTLGIKPIYEAGGQLIPHVFFYSMYISTENDDTLVTENGIAFETEGMPSVEQ